MIGFIVLFSFQPLNLRPCGGGLTLFLLAPVGSDDIVPGCVVYVGTGMSLEFSGTYGVGLILVELDGAVETLDVSRFLWVLDLGPCEDASSVWDVTSRDGVANENLLLTL